MRGTRQRRRRSPRALTAGILAALVLPLAGAGAAAEPDPPAADDGARVVAETWIDERTLDLKIETPALPGTAMVRLLVPRGWSKDATRTWPVLYLLHGCCDPAEYQSWTAFTDVEEFTADKPAIIVMPSGGAIGMYSQWWNYGLSDKPDWPTFHTTELRQILERGYKAGTDRAVAGLSMGGYGAMEYASRFPGMFSAAAAYSGALNTLAPPIPEVTQLNMIAQGFPVWGVLWGDPWSQRLRWMDHNPFDKVERLRGTKLFVSAGDGQPGPIEDPSGPPPAGSLLEEVALGNSRTFTDRLQAAGIPVTTDYYGPGTHTWPYWERALKRSWPLLASGMGIAG
ncbi:alpha/beta hydrolase family protein [Saccharopolyspora hirsuta]|uniref:Esterase family protein n=1 Tax=Saccharopolyspora hirsuta TaxID=1837 RepID=A0A5M7BCJ1_SACHI|nr:alpha/beta hydrolase family protein [Saccharopolyspora hirsuta]KAA5827129.1 esterase family protein [Saccharopolyspora hirsuta]